MTNTAPPRTRAPHPRTAPERIGSPRSLSHADLAAHAARGRQLQAEAIRAAFAALGHGVVRAVRGIPHLGLRRAGLYDAGCPDRTPC